MNMRPETTFKDWIITLLLLCVPVVNIVMLVLWIIDSDKSKPFRKNFAIGYLINQAIIFVVYLLLYVTIFAAVLGAAFKTSSTYSGDTKTVVQQEDTSKVEDKKSDTSKADDKKADTAKKKYKDVQDYFDANPDFAKACSDGVAASSGNTMTAKIEAIDNDIYIDLDVTEAVKAQGITADNFSDYEYDLGESFDAQFAEGSDSMSAIKTSMSELFDYVDAKYINMSISVYAFDNYLSGTDCILDATAQAE